MKTFIWSIIQYVLHKLSRVDGDVSDEEKGARVFAMEFDQYMTAATARMMTASWNYASNLTAENYAVSKALGEEMAEDLKVKYAFTKLNMYFGILCRNRWLWLKVT